MINKNNLYEKYNSILDLLNEYDKSKNISNIKKQLNSIKLKEHDDHIKNDTHYDTMLTLYFKNNINDMTLLNVLLDTILEINITLWGHEINFLGESYMDNVRWDELLLILDKIYYFGENYKNKDEVTKIIKSFFIDHLKLYEIFYNSDFENNTPRCAILFKEYGSQHLYDYILGKKLKIKNKYFNEKDPVFMKYIDDSKQLLNGKFHVKEFRNLYDDSNYINELKKINTTKQFKLLKGLNGIEFEFIYFIENNKTEIIQYIFSIYSGENEMLYNLISKIKNYDMIQILDFINNDNYNLKSLSYYCYKNNNIKLFSHCLMKMDDKNVDELNIIINNNTPINESQLIIKNIIDNNINND